MCINTVSTLHMHSCINSTAGIEPARHPCAIDIWSSSAFQQVGSSHAAKRLRLLSSPSARVRGSHHQASVCTAHVCMHAVYISYVSMYVCVWRYGDLLTQTSQDFRHWRVDYLAAKLHQEHLAPLLVRYGARSLLPPLRHAGGYLEAQLCCGKLLIACIHTRSHSRLCAAAIDQYHLLSDRPRAYPWYLPSRVF